MSVVRRIAAAIGASVLILVFWVAWQLRPDLPGHITSPLNHDDVTAVLSLLAWLTFLLLDLVVLLGVIKLGSRRGSSTAELRLKRALDRSNRSVAPRTAPDWRAFAHTLEPPVLRIPAVQQAPVAVTASVSAELPNSVREVADSRGEDDAIASTRDSPVRVNVLGPFQLKGAARDQPRRKAAAELIAYLAVQPQGATRDELLEALWPNDDPHRSQQRFWQASTEARKLLNGGIRREHDRYLLDHGSVTVDLDELETLLADAGHAERREDERNALERALALFRGEPFAGIATPWAESEARRLRALAVDILERVGRLRLNAGEATGALDAAERGIALDLLNEGLWRLALEAEGALGLREAISERYDALSRTLDERLGLEPDRETRTLHRRLLSQA